MNQWRATRAEVDLDAIVSNAQTLARLVAPAQLCAVVKADGYGHGSVEVAKAALRGGATRLAVALVEEGVALRAARIEAPILVLSEPPARAMEEVVRTRLTPALYTEGGHLALRSALSAAGVDSYPVHVKVDTGMHRVGLQPNDAVSFIARLGADPFIDVEGVFTHLAVADEPDNPYTARQAAAFCSVLDGLDAKGLRPRVVHAANSAGALVHPNLRFDMVRCGIALYGLSPSLEVRAPDDARPAMSVKSEVSYVKRLSAGERLSYGLRYELPEDSYVATVPIGYADGLPRAASAHGGDVLIGGKRYPIAGTVTMDQILIDCGENEVQVGDEVVIFGRQGGSEILAEELARRTESIGYELICRIGPRIPRHY